MCKFYYNGLMYENIHNYTINLTKVNEIAVYAAQFENLSYGKKMYF